MYAFKQMGFCMNCDKDHIMALKAFKKQLQMAWHLRHFPGEFSSYENIAITYFYMGKIEKSHYYIDRVYRGKTEAMFSVPKRISLAYTGRKFRNFKVKPYKADMSNIGKKKGAIFKSENVGMIELFSSKLKNYNLLNDEVLRNLGYFKLWGHM